MTGMPRRRRLASPRLRTDTAQRIGVRRIRWLLVVYGVLVLVTVAKLVDIQVVDAATYADLGARQRTRVIDLTATRGRIYDRDGDVLATSVEAATIYGDPRVFREDTTPEGHRVPAAADPEAVAAELAPLIGVGAADIAERLRRDAHFVYLARQVDHEVGEQVLALELPGIGTVAEPQRVYPAGGLAAQVVGFTGIDGEGLQGLEARYDGVLQGEPGMLALERAPGGLDIASGTRELVPPEAGSDLVLTVDRDIQYAAERAAMEAMETHDAAGASALVLEVGTGEVLAMASVPGFDPNDRGAEDPSTWRNRAVTDVFEPGSTQKALTVAAAIEDGHVDAGTPLTVPPAVTVAGKRFGDAYGHGTETWTVSEIVERSSNVGTIQIAQELGPERLERYLRDFGYGETTGSAFPGESAGLLMPHDEWWGTSLPTIAIGQGVAVTLLQAASSYATIANDGVAVPPRVVRGSVGEDGRLVPAAADADERVIGADTAAQVRGMLEMAVSGDHGTGARAKVDGYRVAGKTGTARKPAQDARGYSDEYVATFVGLAPVEDPRVVVAVMVDEPQTAYFGGVVAAPLFSEVMEAALVARRVPPDDVGTGLDEALAVAASRVEELAAQETPADDPEDPTSPPVGSPVGGDGAAVRAEDDGP